MNMVSIFVKCYYIFLFTILLIYFSLLRNLLLLFVIYRSNIRIEPLQLNLKYILFITYQTRIKRSRHAMQTRVVGQMLHTLSSVLLDIILFSDKDYVHQTYSRCTHSNNFGILDVFRLELEL
jgi:hypothetical protein